ncbi:MAG TPA: tetratricopeptide repeat protein [Pirellulales bacterium]|nr:tetratricopeptide repeat protein [Pirellulales bacterium]
MVARTPKSVIALAVGVLAACLGLTPPACNSALAQTSNGSSVTAWFNRSGSSGGAQATTPPANSNNNDGAFHKFSAKVKKVFSGNPQKTTSIHPKPKTEDDALSLTKPAKPRSDFYISLGRIQERSNNPTAAVEQYKRALELDPNNLTALMALARLYDRQGQFEDALKQYKQATIAYPKEAAAFNDQGLCYARHEQYAEAAACLSKAVELHPERALYRNNLATVLIETGRIDQAFQTLSPVNGAAIAHYNIGFLLNARGRTAPALDQFKLAAASDPKLAAATKWVDTLTTKLASEQPGGPSPADRQPSLPTANPVSKTNTALADATPSLPAIKPAAPPAAANLAEPPAAANTAVASAPAVSATPAMISPQMATPPATFMPSPSSLAGNRGAASNGVDTAAGQYAMSVPSLPPASSPAEREGPAAPVARTPSDFNQPSPVVPSAGPKLKEAPPGEPSIAKLRTDQNSDGQPRDRLAPRSQPAELLAERPMRLPPTPDEIQVYSQNVPPVDANAIVPLPPIDAVHYPPSRY